MKLKVLELFAGTRSIEWCKDFENINLYCDIGKLTAKEILDEFGTPDIIRASPDCTTYSIAAISHHRKKELNGNLSPISEYAKFCDSVNKNMLKLISELKPKYYFIENPRGATCHISAPRGSRTGTQGLKGSVERSRIPKELCNHIVDICEVI